MNESRSLKTKVYPQLRHVRDTDIKDLWMWRNDPKTRINSLNPDYVPWSDHIAWFWQAYGSPDRQILIATSHGFSVGMVRFEHGLADTKLSWTVAPEFRGQGIGKEIVRAAAEMERVKKLVAWVKVVNEASVKIAEYAGFVEESRDNMVIILTRQPK